MSKIGDVLVDFALSILIKRLDKKDVLVEPGRRLKAKVGNKVWDSFLKWLFDDLNKV